jgi:hypothetical protein
MIRLGQLVNRILSPSGIVITRRKVKHNIDVSRPAENYIDIQELLRESKRLVLRHQIATKWSIVDFLLRNTHPKSDIRICPLCGFEGRGMQFARVRSHCIFGGGDLLRYVCPECEVIYGPDKMFELTPAELSEDYEWHYQAYEEGDSTERELRAFFALKPEKGGKYLNYGAGNWSKSVQQLRSQGWDVYAYEPHISASKIGSNEWLLRTSGQLYKMRFDGIFSNNVMEHFRYPVKELKNMMGLLREGGRMAHATPCFEYLYEYTRFHLFFFCGKSKDFLMEQAGLQVIEDVVDGDFICRVMKPKSE